MGTPTCRPFTPTPNQQWKADLLIHQFKSVKKVRNVRASFREAALINGKYSEGGKFKWERKVIVCGNLFRSEQADYILTYTVDGTTYRNSVNRDTYVQSRKFLATNYFVAVWENTDWRVVDELQDE